MQFKKSLLTATLLAATGLTAISANAATATGSFNVKLQVNAVCTVNAATGTQDIDFGAVDAGVAPAANVTSATALSVQCSNGSPYAIALTPASTTNTDGTGTMTNGTDTIAYKLNSDAAGSTVWGSLATNDVNGTGTGTTVAIQHPVYATVTGSTDVTTGAYSDTVNVAVTY